MRTIIKIIDSNGKNKYKELKNEYFFSLYDYDYCYNLDGMLCEMRIYNYDFYRVQLAKKIELPEKCIYCKMHEFYTDTDFCKSKCQDYSPDKNDICKYANKYGYIPGDEYTIEIEKYFNTKRIKNFENENDKK